MTLKDFDIGRAITMLEEKAAQGVEIHGFFTTSSTPFGISICQRVGF